MKMDRVLLESLLVGFLVAGVIICIQHFTAEGSGKSNITKVVQFEPNHQSPIRGESQAKLTISAAPSSLHSTNQFEVTRQTLCLFEILFNQETSPFQYYKVVVPLPLSKFFRCLFKSIISPNAP
jgi:hypothetical protein